MQILEDRVPLRSGEVIDRRNRALAVIGGKCAPRGKQGCRKVGDRAANRLRQVAPRSDILLALEQIYAKHQASDAIVLVGQRYALGVFHRLVDITINQKRQESTVEQFGIVWIALERRPIIGGRRSGIALLAGVPRSKITARSA